MEVREDLIVINASPAQKEILKNPKHAEYVKNMILDLENWNRPRVLVSKIEEVVAQLKKLRATIGTDADYAKRQPRKVIDRIILNIEDAASAHMRAYPPSTR